MIFSENNNEYFLEVSQLLSPEEVQSGLWLIMAGIDDIPPHIALINDRLYYSVSAKKVERGVPVANFFKAISRHSRPTLFIQVKAPLNPPIRGMFERYPVLGLGEHSCLWPVRDVFAEIFSEKYKNASLVFELLKMAQEDELILGCKALFTPSVGSPQEGNHNASAKFLSPLGGNKKGVSLVVLPKYTHAQIREKINSIIKVNG